MKIRFVGLLVGACLSGLFASPCLDAGELHALSGDADRVSTTLRAMSPSSLSSVEETYRVGRDMQERLRRLPVAPAACRSAAGWANRLADNAVRAAEGLDRLDQRRSAAARAAANTAAARFTQALARCPRSASWTRRPAGYFTPQTGAATFGEVIAVIPARTDRAVLSVNGRRVGLLAIRGNRAAGRLTGPPGRYTVRVEFMRGGTRIGALTSRNVTLLPPSARTKGREPNADAGMTAGLAGVGRRFNGSAAIWVHDLRTGRAGAWNAGARFPAASTVKLGLMIRAARVCRGAFERCPHAYDIDAIGTWSSNLATNRLLATFDAAEVRRQLVAVGARSSTFPGGYQVATARPVAGVTDQPTLNTQRVTTAEDLANTMLTVHRSALGDTAATRATRLDRNQSLAVLGSLLRTERSGDNNGLINPSIGSTVAAEKQGWISSARLTAAIVYRTSGPVIVVAAAARPGLSLAAAQAFGSTVMGQVR